MKKKCLIILLLTIFILPLGVFAAGGFDVSSVSVSLYPGESKTITISTNNAVGRLNISSSNSGVASVSPGSVFIQNPGSNENITVAANSAGTATISVVASNNFATMDEEILEGQAKTITVTVKEKPATPPTQPANSGNNNNNNNNNKPSNTNINNNLSKNNNLKSLTVDGYKLIKVDNNNYTLSVGNDVTSIKVNATSEDSKAKVSGNGIHEIKVGENNIDVIITSESGVQNKINIKVNRKDGYYLEDLETVLKNDKISDCNIVITSDSKISKEDIAKIKDSKKVIKLNYFEQNKKLIYSWTIDGKEIKDATGLVTTITNVSDNTKEIYKLSNYADGLYVNFKHSGKLPAGTKIKLYVGDKFENNSVVNVYHYNNEKLNFIKDNLKVIEGYIEFDIEHCSEYFITMSTITISTINANTNTNKTESSTNIFMILIVTLVIIAGLITFIFFKINSFRDKKDDKK